MSAIKPIDQLTNTVIGVITELKEDKISLAKAIVINRLANTAIRSSLFSAIHNKSIESKEIKDENS